MELQKSQNYKPFFFPNATPSKPLVSISISIRILLISSLPFFYISLLHIPLSNLLKDTAFWFLLSNTIIIIIVTIDSSTLSSNPYVDINGNIYDEFMLHNKERKQSFMAMVPMKNSLALSHEEERVEARRKEEIVEEDAKNEEESLGESVRSKSKEKSEERSDYWSMTDEELKIRVEEFIRLNRETMLQEARK